MLPSFNHNKSNTSYPQEVQGRWDGRNTKDLLSGLGGTCHTCQSAEGAKLYGNSSSWAGGNRDGHLCHVDVRWMVKMLMVIIMGHIENSATPRY